MRCEPMSLRSQVERMLRATSARCPNEPTGPILFREEVRSPVLPPPPLIEGPPPCPFCGRTHIRGVVIVRQIECQGGRGGTGHG
jgi:hypothetical protein